MFILWSKVYVVLCAINIGNTQKTLGKIINGTFSNVQQIIKNEKKSDSFTAHYDQHLNYTTSCNDLHNCMPFKLVKLQAQSYWRNEVIHKT